MTMERDGKYIYCIIGADCECDFGPIGIGGRGDLVSTIGFEGISMVVSDHPLNRFVVDPDGILAHQRVIEAVMKEHESVIPVRFGTVAATPDEIRNLLDRRYGELSELLLRLRNKVEFNVTGRWHDMAAIYKEVERTHPEIKEQRARIESMRDGGGEALKQSLILDTGHQIEAALEVMKEEKCDAVASLFRKTAMASKMNRTTSPDMFMNAAFLIDRGREVESDGIMEIIGQKDADRCDYRYSGPLAIFNFVDLRILPEKWEL